MSMTIETESGTATFRPRGPQGYSSGNFTHSAPALISEWLTSDPQVPATTLRPQVTPTSTRSLVRS